MSEKMSGSNVFDQTLMDNYGNFTSLMNWRPDNYRTTELVHLLSESTQLEGDWASSEQMRYSSGNSNWENQIDMTRARVLQLRFSGNICQHFYTGDPVKGENGHSLVVTLVDCQSGSPVTFGPEASARVEIVGLKADCGACLGDRWSREEFESKIIRIEGTKRLLTGNVFFNLKGGVGFAGNFHFFKDRTHKKTCAYRLGAIVTDDSIGTKIKEGLTDSFVVKDYRQKYTEKHYPPKQSSEVWRLVGIGYDGPFHLSLRKQEVNTVGDLLIKLNTDPDKLRDVLNNMSVKAWDALVTHARTCIIDTRLHLYSSSGSQHGVLFNVVGQVIGLFLESQYVIFEMLSELEQAYAVTLVETAYQQLNEVVTFNNEASLLEYLESAVSINCENESEKPIDPTLHLYSSSGSQGEASVIFNTVGRVIGLFSESQYVTFEMLPESEKAHAIFLLESAYQQQNEVVSFTNEASLLTYLSSGNYCKYTNPLWGKSNREMVPRSLLWCEENHHQGFVLEPLENIQENGNEPPMTHTPNTWVMRSDTV